MISHQVMSEERAPITVKQGNKKPWINNQNYLKDIFEKNYGKIEDNSLNFHKF
ncbi:MAG: hypothetical protein Ct9H90mP6_08250 [Gammaproteobacteria bacterium]|nr:MAG: hypothetical protein Ct9H90mP6_08250 [Gammaproteobacteria bacterium]